MRGRHLVRLLCLAAAWLAGAVAPAEPPRRVASLNLTADELLVELIAPERLVAVTRWADDRGMSNVVERVPPSALRLPRADLERLIALEPDLVVVSEFTDADFIHLLETSGLRQHRLRDLASLEGIRQAILDLGRAVEASAAAARLVARYDAVLGELARRLEGVKRPRVLYWADPHTAGAETPFDALIRAAGGTNVGRELGLVGMLPIAGERAFTADPDAFLVSRGSGAAEALRRHPLLSKARAVREGDVVEMPNALLVTLSHHAATACWHLASRLHPERVPPDLPRP
jgi:iron complex transport system substrate-binding protein